MINRILATIDNSLRSQSVFDTSVSLAQATGAKLMLLHILSDEDIDYPILPTYAYYAVLKGKDDSVFHKAFDEYERGEEELLRNLAQKAIALGIDTEYAQLSGIPGWTICEIASEWSADLILVGSRGLKGLKEMFLGSVSNYVTHHAPCSVLIVRTDTDLVSYGVDFPYEEAEEAESTQEVLKQN
ncbi:universal stress protein [Waterburya agarophytonicola K14]|uniref:Universal stress protein n=1 Tax=Waterburya agarophytonicola KI4 TaxID=2874699 RepID=A0A964BRA8_9CYAN|nr:universal stress protein [Waterburya agarophytonicola]MCC0177774.1 universal stress protein [Waterburya agarophytonicola KI4]